MDGDVTYAQNVLSFPYSIVNKMGKGEKGGPCIRSFNKKIILTLISIKIFLWGAKNYDEDGYGFCMPSCTNGLLDILVK